MTMNNEYWAERFLLLNEMLLQKGEAYQKQLEEVYAMVFLSIEKEINDFYNRFAKNNAITFQEAKTLLDSRQREAFQMTLQEYIQYGSMEGVDEKWLKKLENASTVHRITMLQAIQYQLQHHAERLTAKKAEGLTRALKEIYKEGYYRTAYTMQINNPFAKIDENKIEKVLSRPWSPDGKNFSQRIWGSDRSNLIHQLNTRFTQGIIRGEAREKIIKDMKKALNSSAQATKRLVLTESAFVASASRKDCFEQLGVEKYQFLATLDLKTSVICQDMDGKVFERKDYQIGVTAPPMHPHCRSTTVPYFDDTLTQTEQRAARGEDGKTHYVPADMTYKEWYKAYVEKRPNSNIEKFKAESSKQLENLTEQQKQAIKKYTGNSAYEINRRLAKGEDLGRYKEQAEQISSALQKCKITRDIVVQRKTILEHLNIPNEIVQQIKNNKNLIVLLKNKVITNKSFTSTSMIDFDYLPRDVVVKFKVPEGYKGAAYIKNIAYQKYQDQEEVLFDRGLKYKIVSAKIENNNYYLEAEVIL